MIWQAYDLRMSGEQLVSGDPADVLGYLLKQAHLRLGALADAALGPLGVDRKEFGVLRALAASGAVSQQALAASVGIDPTTMVAVIDALERVGRVARRPDAADRRRNLVDLTDAGRTTLHAAAAAYAAAEAAFLAPLASAEATQLRRALRAVLAG